MKQKSAREVARTITEKNGESLSNAEHEDPLSQIKAELVQMEDEKVETIKKFKTRNKTCDAMCTESLHLHTNGCVY